MPSTYDDELVGSILGQIEEALDTIRLRTRSIQRPDDFTATPEGREKLDSVCMLFMAIGIRTRTARVGSQTCRQTC